MMVGLVRQQGILKVFLDHYICVIVARTYGVERRRSWSPFISIRLQHPKRKSVYMIAFHFKAFHHFPIFIILLVLFLLLLVLLNHPCCCCRC
jgi:hypothetical protein